MHVTIPVSVYKSYSLGFWGLGGWFVGTGVPKSGIWAPLDSSHRWGLKTIAREDEKQADGSTEQIGQKQRTILQS